MVAKFLLVGSYGPEALAAAANQGFEGRVKYIEELAESLGMTIETAYFAYGDDDICLLYTSPSPRDRG